MAKEVLEGKGIVRNYVQNSLRIIISRTKEGEINNTLSWQC